MSHSKRMEKSFTNLFAVWACCSHLSMGSPYPKKHLRRAHTANNRRSSLLLLLLLDYHHTHRQNGKRCTILVLCDFFLTGNPHPQFLLFSFFLFLSLAHPFSIKWLQPRIINLTCDLILNSNTKGWGLHAYYN